MILPNFIIAGAPKSATSTLYEYLKQHPDIFMSPVKEPFFFDFNFERGIEYYAKFFEKYNGETAIGEATVWYMSWAAVPERIYQTIPDVKLIFILRDPVERAFSNYLMDLRSGHYTPKQTFGYVIRNEGKVSGIDRRIVSGGFYYRHVKRFEQYFSRKNMLFIVYDDFKSNIREVEKSVYRFLEVDDSFAAESPPNKMVGEYIRHQELLIHCSASFPPFNYCWSRSRHFRQIFLNKSSQRNLINSVDRKYLLDVYLEENQRLAEYLNVNLDAWCSFS
ncbi:MAG: sulfotransferase domain-containing protein [Elainella sp. Prado103]|jgi:hypothetical protein|nr:sulfotransferase domain-containing protein [Elainella sp. Prado103]